MPEMEDKGPLIKKKSRPDPLARPKPVIQNRVFDFDPVLKNEEKPERNELKIDKPKPQIDTENKPQAGASAAKTAPRMKPITDKPVNNSERMIKMSKDLHTSIMALGSFMDEKKGYGILEKLVQHYTEHELTERQKDQFKFLTQILTDDKK